MRQTMIDKKTSMHEAFQYLLKEENQGKDEKLLRKRKYDTSQYFSSEQCQLFTERNFIDCIQRYSTYKLSEATLVSYLKDIGFYQVLSYRTRSNKNHGIQLENQVIRFIKFTQEFSNLASFFEYLTFYRNQIHKDKKDCIKVMTIHQAKGLEFEKVFLLGWNDGTIPSRLCYKDSDPQSSHEEERRVAYVALTRAREQVIISYSKVYRKDDKEYTLYPSLFLKESNLVGLKMTDLTNQKPQMTCFSCGGRGHIQKECTQPHAVKCFRCNQRGHISSECNNFSSNMKCFNCNSDKHLARDCSDKKNNLQCYKCKKTGHYANKCHLY